MSGAQRQLAGKLSALLAAAATAGEPKCDRVRFTLNGTVYETELMVSTPIVVPPEPLAPAAPVAPEGS